MLRRTRPVLASIAASLLLGVAAQAQPSAPIPSPGTYYLPDASTPFLTGSPIKLGGFSALRHAGGNEFWTITDRGPNLDSGDIKVFADPAFNPMIVRFRANPDGTLSLVQTITLKNPSGVYASGLPNPAPYSTGEVARDLNFNLLPPDDWGFDTEGLLLAPDGTFWFCEEYAPGIAQVSADGTIIRRVRPQSTPGGLPDILRRHVSNRGMEGIAMTPNGKIYAIVQSGMANSYSNTSSANDKASQQTEVLRLVEFDPATNTSRMLAYMMDAGYPNSGSDIRKRDIKIGDMAALNNNELIITEHAQRGTQNSKKIYKVNIADATPITSEVYETSPGVFKSLEELSRTQITTVAGITPVSKTLLLDLLNPGPGNPQWPIDADKPEGLTLINGNTLAVCNDNDFGVIAPAADGRLSFSGTRTRLFVYHLNTVLDYQTGIQASFTQSGQNLATSNALFTNTTNCAGESVTSLPVTVTNTGLGDLTVYGVDFYRTDSLYGQGAPRYALLRDTANRLIPATDYVITAAPAVAPLTANTPVTFPVVLPQGASATVYVNFVPQRADKRYARAFIRTSATNLSAVDTNGISPITPNWGLLSVDLFGRGLASVLGNDMTGAPLKPLVFPTTSVREASDMTFTIMNSGTCDLRINRKTLDINAGDVSDFAIVSAFTNTRIDAKTGDYILAPSTSTSVTVRFAPQRSGSRRATLWLKSNDSTQVIPGITERGSYYVDLYGVGKVVLTAGKMEFPAAAIGRDTISGSIRIENASRDAVTLTSLTIIGADAQEYAAGRAAWPATPLILGPAGTLDLPVLFQPSSNGTPGTRSAWVIGVTSNGDTVRASLSGIAGTRMLTVTPKNLFTAVSIGAGKSVHGYVALTNVGTLPLTIGTFRLTGADSANYAVALPTTNVLAAGSSITLDILFLPKKTGASQAMLLIANNASMLDTVMLGGTASRTQHTPEDASGSARTGLDVRGLIGAGSSEDATSGTADVASSNGSTEAELSLLTPIPSPIRDEATIVYRIPVGGQIVLDLFDANGRLVREIARGQREPGQHNERLDAEGLTSGIYQCRLQIGGTAVSRSIVIVR